jgi:hypothetical protein
LRKATARELVTSVALHRSNCLSALLHVAFRNSETDRRPSLRLTGRAPKKKAGQEDEPP